MEQPKAAVQGVIKSEPKEAAEEEFVREPPPPPGNEPNIGINFLHIYLISF